MSENPKTVHVSIYCITTAYKLISLCTNVAASVCQSQHEEKLLQLSEARMIQKYSDLSDHWPNTENVNYSPKNYFKFINYDHLQLYHYNFGMYKMFITLPY